MSHPALGALAQPADGQFVMIPLTHGKFAIVDEADAELVLAGSRWTAIQPKTHTWYAIRYAGPPKDSISMHILVAGYKGVDHINGNGLDNRRINLRPATRQQNSANCGPQRNNTSGYKGVSWHRKMNKWVSQIRVNGRAVHLGSFTDPVEAARAYNRAAAGAFGEYAWLNPLPPPLMSALPPRSPARRPRAPAQPPSPVDYGLATPVAQAVMEFPRARHWDRYLTWRAGVKMKQMRPVLLHLVEKGWLEVEREQGRRPERHYYTATEAGRDGFTALLTVAEICA